MSSLKIGKKIKGKRRERELTQEELANMLGVSKAAVSKWENDESFPDITMLPQIARLFHITMDELFDYTLEYKPMVIVNEYQFGFALDDVDRRILDHGTVKLCEICKYSRLVGENMEDVWGVRVQFVSTEENFPYILQKYIKPGALIDGISVRLADGKAVMDDKPNKHFVCSEKVWEYNIKDRKYLCQMLKELREMGLSDEDDV
ncbi:MAG: helix-turn-helix transcriptional regulator [Ruminococcaceae bacterium]|nr:helix-turn-helix transcriptional regulator [Oscillospiraceae bacterium]